MPLMNIYGPIFSSYLHSTSSFDTSTWLPHRLKTKPWLPIGPTPNPWPNFLMTFSNFPILLVSSTTIHPVAKATVLGLILEVELFLAHHSQTICKFAILLPKYILNPFPLPHFSLLYYYPGPFHHNPWNGSPQKSNWPPWAGPCGLQHHFFMTHKYYHFLCAKEKGWETLY